MLPLRDRDRALPLNGATSPRPLLITSPTTRGEGLDDFCRAALAQNSLFRGSEEACAMKNWKLRLASLLRPAVMLARKRTQGEKKAEINKEMSQEQRDHMKDAKEIARDETNPTERAEELRKENQEHTQE